MKYVKPFLIILIYTAVGCCAVFIELLFGKTSKILQGIPVGIFKEFSAVLAESSQ